MKLKFCYGDSVTLVTDPHAGVAKVKGTVLRAGNNLTEVEWPSGVTEFVHESELRPSNIQSDGEEGVKGHHKGVRSVY